MRTVIVGASSGLGRSLAIGLYERGARVALLGRRRDRLEEAAAAAGDDAVVVPCDVTEEAQCRDAVAQAAGELDGIDALVYASGFAPLAPVEQTDAATWRRTLDTNVVGAALVTAAALPHLRRTGGTAAYLSSVSASITAPWPGLAAYVTSKAALDKMIEAWRVEHPDVGFTRVVVGDCGGGEGHSATEMASAWDEQLAAELFPRWFERGLISGTLVEVDDLVDVVDAVVRAGATVPSVAVTPRGLRTV